MIKKDEKKISSSFEENIAYMDQVLPVKESFDMIKREMEIGGRKSFFYFINIYCLVFQSNLQDAVENSLIRRKKS